MDQVAPAGRVYQAGTLSANPVGMRAGLAALAKMQAVDGWRELESRTSWFCDELTRSFEALRRQPQVVRHGSIFWIHAHADQPVRQPSSIPSAHASWFSSFFHAALERGVYLAPSPYEVGFVSLAHDRDTLSRAAAVLFEAASAGEMQCA
jgi:glutamate-1-semialdehyde 2,1-aminomutase